jgi:hypothetical protein
MPPVALALGQIERHVKDRCPYSEFFGDITVRALKRTDMGLFECDLVVSEPLRLNLTLRLDPLGAEAEGRYE